MKPFDVYSVFDIEPVAAKGSVLTDVSGRQYLDLYGGHAVISIGHAHPVFNDALHKQLDAIAYYSNSVRIPLQEELAEKLGHMSGYPDYSLFLCNSGAEANENAVKLASFHTGRSKIICFEGAFHGRTSLAVEATDNPAIAAPVNCSGHIVRLPLNDVAAFDAALNSEVAAVLIEGIQGVAGIAEPSAAFLQHLEQACRAHGACLILDEVQSGCGRTGRFFAHQHSGIRPHLITVAKGMGNGFPVGGVLIHPMFEAKKERLGTTFGGSYMACAAAIAVLDVMEQENLVERAAELGSLLSEELCTVKGVRRIKGKGLMLGLEFDFPVAALRKHLLEQHAMFTGSSACPRTIRLLPALNLSRDHAAAFVKALSESLATAAQ